MTLSDFKKSVISIIGLNADFPVYEYFPDIPVSEKIYSVVGISSMKINRNMNFSRTKSMPVSLQLKISLFAPAGTDKSTLPEKFEKDILNVLLNSNIRITEISDLKTDFIRNLKLFETYSFINISGTINLSAG